MTIIAPEALRPASHFKQPERGHSARDTSHDFSGILSGREALASVVSEAEVVSDETVANAFSDLAFFQQTAVPASLVYEGIDQSLAAEANDTDESNSSLAKEGTETELSPELRSTHPDQIDHLSGLRIAPNHELVVAIMNTPRGLHGSAGPAAGQAADSQPIVSVGTGARVKIETGQSSAAQGTARPRTEAPSLSAFSLCLRLEGDEVSISARVSGLSPDDEAELEQRIRDELVRARLGLQDIALNGRRSRILGKE